MRQSIYEIEMFLKGISLIVLEVILNSATYISGRSQMTLRYFAEFSTPPPNCQVKITKTAKSQYKKANPSHFDGYPSLNCLTDVQFEIWISNNV